MKSGSYLIFRLRGVLYAVDSHHAREAFWLPELAPVEEAPPYVVGLLNLRGKILPVIDLDIRFGHSPKDYGLTDSVIVLDTGDLQAGIIATEVLDVGDIPAADIETALAYGREEKTRPHLISGEAKFGQEIVLILEPENIVRCAEPLEYMAPHGLPPAPPAFRPDASPGERAIFRERARNLSSAPEIRQLVLTPVAVVGLSGEYYGIDLEVVREFADLRNVAPVPCCPEHIAGNMNLRGNILTLVDIRGSLSAPPGSAGAPSKVAVVAFDDIVAGVVIDEVFEVVYLDPSEIVPPPSAARMAGDKHIKGVTPYGGKMMAILDLPGILAQERLAVNEEA